MAVSSVIVTKKRADGTKVKRTITNLNPLATDREIAQAILALEELSENTIMAANILHPMPFYNNSTITADSVVAFSGYNSTLTVGDSINSTIYSDATDSKIRQQNYNNIIKNKPNYIKNTGSGNSITGGYYNDTIINSGDNVTINLGYAKDSLDVVYNSGDMVSIIGTYAASINNTGSNVTIAGTGGNKTIISGGADSFITNSGNDSIYNSADRVTIAAGNGNDTVINYGQNVSINPGAGNDSVFNYAENVTITGGGAVVENYAQNVIFETIGNGNNQIYNTAENVTINTGTGNDSIYNTADNISIRAGVGNDTIVNYAKNVTIVPGRGTFDSVFNYNTDSIGNVYQFSKGEMGTKIEGFDLDNDRIYFVDVTSDTTIQPVIESDKKVIDILRTDGNSNTVVKIYAGNDTVYSFNHTPKVITDTDTDIIEVSPRVFSSPLNQNGNAVISAQNNFGTITAADPIETIIAYNNATLSNYKDGVFLKIGSGVSSMYGEIYNAGDNLTITGGNYNNITNRAASTFIKLGGNERIVIEPKDNETVIDSNTAVTVIASVLHHKATIARDYTIYTADTSGTIGVVSDNNFVSLGAIQNESIYVGGNNNKIYLFRTNYNSTLNIAENTSNNTISTNLRSSDSVYSKKNVKVIVGEGSHNFITISPTINNDNTDYGPKIYGGANDRITWLVGAGASIGHMTGGGNSTIGIANDTCTAYLAYPTITSGEYHYKREGEDEVKIYTW